MKMEDEFLSFPVVCLKSAEDLTVRDVLDGKKTVIGT
jgi:hypothetical protein